MELAMGVPCTFFIKHLTVVAALLFERLPEMAVFP